MSRRTGITTRTVDHAVQMLFKHGYILLPMSKPNDDYFRGRDIEELLIIDPAAYDPTISFNRLQSHLKGVLLRRISLEHSTVSLEIERDRITLVK